MTKVLVVGDALVDSNTLEKAALELAVDSPIEIVKLEWHSDLPKNEFQEYILKIETEGPENIDLPPDILNEIVDADVLMVHYAPVSASMINKAEKLKLIGTCRGGTEHVNLEKADEKEIPVLHVIRNAEPVAEFTLGLILSETRNIARAHSATREGKWRKTFSNDAYKTTISNLKFGLVGLGYIGKLVAQKLVALGAEVVAYDPYIRENEVVMDDLNNTIKLVELEDLFANSDVVSLHARVTEDNINMVNSRLINLMKPSSYIINTARAGLLEKKALVNALKNNKIAGAALDVIWEEPISKNDELLELDNLTITSHIGGDTVDAIPLSPLLLKNEMNKYLKAGNKNMIVNNV